MNRLVIALMSVCIAGAVILAGTDLITSGPIAEEKRREMVRSLDSVLPPHANSPDQDNKIVTLDNGEKIIFYTAKRFGAPVGTAMMVTAPDGYSGNIDVMVGLDQGGALSGVAILSHAETPGLGDKIITDQTWLPWFRGRTLENTHWAVKKDGGEVDQFTGATITPRAVTGAVKRALEICRDHCD
jgi:electron transport complex protein RnfG